MGSGEIVVMIEKQRFQISVVKHHLWIGPWWWPSGQRAHLLLRRSEFESHWGLQYFCKIVIEKNENKQKEARVGPFFLKKKLIKDWFTNQKCLFNCVTKELQQFMYGKSVTLN